MGHPSRDAVVADLLERLCRQTDFDHAAPLALGTVLEPTRFDRACLLVRSERDVSAAGWNLTREEIEEASALARVDGSRLAGAFSGERPVRLRAAADGEEETFAPRLAIPLVDDGDAATVVTLDADGPDADTEYVQAVLRRCVRPVMRLARLRRLEDRTARLEGDRQLRCHVIDGIPDPLLLIDSDRRVVMTNSRADRLFFVEERGSDGWNRAVQFNAFHLNVFLTEMSLGEETSTRRELTLADPRDGSDLYFEILRTAVPVADGSGGHLVLVLKDITDLNQAATELEMENRRARARGHAARQESKRLNAILENAAEPMLVTDANSDIVLMNREAERLFGGSGNGPPPPGEHGVSANVTKLTSFVSDLLLENEERQVNRFELVDPIDGGALPVEVVSTKILDDHREPMAVVSVLRDLTPLIEKQDLARELRALNEELEERVEEATTELEERNRLLEWQSAELERASRMKSQFLASMSHELRTPINAMLGYTSLMQDRIYGPLTDQQGSALRKMNAASEHLLELINDILDLSKIEAGKMPLEVEDVRLSTLIDELRQTVEPMLRRKSLELDVREGEGVPVLRTDRTKLRQVLLNLLENAIKYTHEGGVGLHAGVTGDGDRLRIEVRDTGRGIESEHLEEIFEDFRQLGRSELAGDGGTGLGLSISRKLVSLMGGTITAESEVDVGTCFTVEVPTELEPGAMEEQFQRVLLTPPGGGDGMPSTPAEEPDAEELR